MQLRFVAPVIAALLLSTACWRSKATVELDLDDVDAATTARLPKNLLNTRNLTCMQATGFMPLHAVRVLFPTPDHVYKGPSLHFEV